MKMRFEPAGGLSGELRAPPDKSISHRAALLGAMASEPVRIERYLHAADTDSTLAAVRSLGALVELRDEDTVIVRGTGLREARQPERPIDVGNAGTLLRLLPGWLAAQEGSLFTLDGDASIRRRPVDRIAEPLRLMGAELSAREERFPPLTVRGAHLRAISYELAVASAQVKSCVLLAALAADGATTVGEPTRSRDHTERMLLGAGVAIHRNGRRVTVVNADELLLDGVRVPGDPSSAAFLVTAGVLVPGSRLLIGDVGVNWTRTGFLRIVRRMHGIVLGDLEEETGELSPLEPISDLDVAHGQLEGTVVEADEVPLAIDELPLVALLGCFAEGETLVRGAQELRLKESDRIAAVVEGLRGLGAEIEATEDGFAVRGTGGLRGGVIDARGDHRTAMLGAIAGLASQEGVEVRGMEAAAVSYPGFVADVAALCS
ncbi:MAG TPA: 3-phosphoshikimate 1-carboxyvinyltransferase [Solirubrobacteraceae bacterium]|jgi:3-phosphoshikimate 1-carboxyvinyltransferase|nr:3-phosphoshikimate 1-carboxyvinyltransferase [Solirubrobacteraceae bacterium]